MVVVDDDMASSAMGHLMPPTRLEHWPLQPLLRSVIKLFKLGRLDMYRIMIFVWTQDNEIQDVVFDANDQQFSDTAGGMENYGKNS